MKQRRNNFLEGAILPSLLKFAVPVLLALVLQALYGAVDLWAVGKFGTTADISAVSTGSQTMQIVTGIVTGLSMGTTVLLGQRIGHKDDEGSALTVGTSIKVFSILGITLSFVMVLAAKPIAHWMNAPKEAFTQTVHYIQICGGGSLCIVLIICSVPFLEEWETPNRRSFVRQPASLLLSAKRYALLPDRFLPAAVYPSSTTMLALCILPTAMIQLKSRIRHIAVRRAVLVTLGALTAFMVVGRLISGVHWLTDIIGGVLLSVGLVMLYAFATKRQGKSRKNSLACV